MYFIIKTIYKAIRGLLYMFATLYISLIVLPILIFSAFFIKILDLWLQKTKTK